MSDKGSLSPIGALALRDASARHLRRALVDEQEQAANTKRAYAASWRAFERWCRARALTPLPAAPADVAAFISDERARGLKMPTIELRLAAIARAHHLADLPNPSKSSEVSRALNGIRKGLAREGGLAQRKKRALVVADLRAICRRLEPDLRGHRDRALLLIGFCGAFRRSELVGLRVADVEQAPEGIVLTLRRGKTDQEGRGRRLGIAYGQHESTCPVTALRRWLEAAAITEGPLFRGIDQAGHVLGAALATKSVARIVKDRGRQIGLDPAQLGAHSLRSGLATSAAAHGLEERQIARITGHKSMAVLRGYIQEGTLFDVQIPQELGL